MDDPFLGADVEVTGVERFDFAIADQAVFIPAAGILCYLRCSFQRVLVPVSSTSIVRFSGNTIDLGAKPVHSWSAQAVVHRDDGTFGNIICSPRPQL